MKTKQVPPFMGRAIAANFDKNAHSYNRLSLAKFRDMAVAHPFLTITALTVPDLYLTSNPFKGDIFKLARVNIECCVDYERYINKRRAMEGKPETFEAKPRRWGRALISLPLVIHQPTTGPNKGLECLYLSCFVLEVLNTQYRTSGGTVIPERLVRPFVKERSTPIHLGLDSEAIFRNYEVRNIVSVVHGPKGYILG